MSYSSESSSGSKQTAKQIGRLIQAYPKTKLKPENIQAYTDELSHLDADTLERAISVVIQQRCKFFPSVSEIIQATRPAVDMSNPDKRKATSNHASMCSGMESTGVKRYFHDNQINVLDVDMPYFWHLLAKDESDRNRLLAKQWPHVYTESGKRERPGAREPEEAGGA